MRTFKLIDRKSLENADTLWKTHLPSLSLSEYKVVNKQIQTDKIVIYIGESDIFNNKINFEIDSSDTDNIRSKRSIHLNKEEALKRLGDYLKKNKKDIMESVEQNENIKHNLNIFFNDYPEYVI